MARLTPEQALIQVYRDAVARLRVEIRTALESGNLGTAVYLNRQLDTVRNSLRVLGARTRPLANATALDAYGRGVRVANLAVPQAGFRFAGVHREAVESIAANLAGSIDDARDLVGRRAADAFRTAALRETGTGVAAGATRRQVSAAIERRLISEGVTDALTGFVDRAGKRWSLDVYARMAARTTTREAVSVGTRNRMQETGQDLITISTHATSCEICQPYEGQTYSLSGAAGYEEATDDVWPPYHPNCLHVATPGSGDLEADVEALIGSVGAGA